jgi:hypothetical protein
VAVSASSSAAGTVAPSASAVPAPSSAPAPSQAPAPVPKPEPSHAAPQPTPEHPKDDSKPAPKPEPEHPKDDSKNDSAWRDEYKDNKNGKKYCDQSKIEDLLWQIKGELKGLKWEVEQLKATKQ